MAPRRAPLGDLSNGFVNERSAPRKRRYRSYVDLDQPLDATAAYTSNAGVKRRGGNHSSYIGDSEYRISKNKNDRKLSQAAYSLEDEDNKAWAAALDELETGSVRKPAAPKVVPASDDRRRAVDTAVTPVASPAVKTETASEPPTSKQVPARKHDQKVTDATVHPVKAISRITAATSAFASALKKGFTSFTMPDTISKGVKRKQMEPDSSENTDPQKRRVGHTGCKRTIKQEDDSVRDAVMCYCDNPLHAMSDEWG
jgi:hypothetical protein